LIVLDFLIKIKEVHLVLLLLWDIYFFNIYLNINYPPASPSYASSSAMPCWSPTTAALAKQGSPIGGQTKQSSNLNIKE
jgi:hypothetical protein